MPLNGPVRAAPTPETKANGLTGPGPEVSREGELGILPRLVGHERMNHTRFFV